MARHPDRGRPRDARRPGGTRSAGTADPGRARRPRVRAARRPADRRLPDDAGRADARRGRGRRRRSRCGAARSTRSASGRSSWSRRSLRRPRSRSATSTWCGRCRPARPSSRTRSSSSRRLREIGQAVSSSLDLDEVLTTIVRTRVQLTDTDGGSLLEYDDDHARVPRSAPRSARVPSCSRRCAARHISLDGTLVGRACPGRASRRCVATSKGAQLDPHLERLARGRLAIGAGRADAPRGRHRRGPRRAPRRPGDFSPGDLRAAADVREPVGAGDRQRAAVPRAGAQDGRAPGRQPAQVGVPGQHVARAAHPTQRGHRLLRGAAAAHVRRHQRPAGGVPPRHPRAPGGICSSCSTTSSTCPRSRPVGWSWTARRSRTEALEYGLSMVRERAAAHGITLRLEVDPDVDDVEADELRFKQVVLNLLSNAVKFTRRRRPGARCGARAATARICEITSPTPESASPIEDRERIFESFQQAGRSPQSKRGHRARTDALPPDRRAVRRPAVARERGRRGSTFGFTIPSPARHAQAAAGRHLASERRAGHRRGRGRPPFARAASRSTSRVAGCRSWRPATARRAGGGPASPPGGGRAGHPAAWDGRLAGSGGAQGRSGHGIRCRSWSSRCSTSARRRWRSARPSTS